MDFGSYGIDKTGRKVGEPHPEAQKNYERADQILRAVDFKKSKYGPEQTMKYEIYDRICKPIKNAQGILDSFYEISDPKYVLFLWKGADGKQFTCVISFHQTQHEFNKEFDDWLQFLKTKGAIKTIDHNQMNTNFDKLFLGN